MLYPGLLLYNLYPIILSPSCTKIISLFFFSQCLSKHLYCIFVNILFILYNSFINIKHNTMLIPTKGNVIAEKISDSQFYNVNELKGKVVSSGSEFILEGDLIYFIASNIIEGFLIVNEENILAYERN